MWTVVYLAHSHEIAEKLQQCLLDSGLLVTLRPIESGEDSDNYYEVMVPEHEVEKAHSVIIEKDF